MDGLTQRDLNAIRMAYVKALDLEQQVERAKACNFECSEVDQRCQHAKLQCERIIKTYGPIFPDLKQ